jgi:hypothetical protein
MKRAKCCKKCVLNHRCFFQDNDDVESCRDYEEQEQQERDEYNYYLGQIQDQDDRS